MTADLKFEGTQEAPIKAEEELVKVAALEEKSEEPKSVAEEKSKEEAQSSPAEEKSKEEAQSSPVEEKSKGNEAEDKDDVSCPAATITKSSSFKEESNFLSDLKEPERKALSELRTKLEEAILDNMLFKKEEVKEPKPEGDGEEVKAIDEEVSLWGVPLLPSKSSERTDVVLLKFLRAREFRVKEALEMLTNTLQWRKQSNIDSILDEDSLGEEELQAACYMDGTDREGHPVCYNVPSVFQDDGLYRKAFGTEEGCKKFLRWRVQLMEQGIKRLDLRPGGAASMLQITDLKNSPGPSKKELRTTMKVFVEMLQDNYPEFVARNIFINVPFWYYAFHALLSPFLTQRTKSKMVFVRPAKVTETLLKYIPAEAIPAHYGGLKREDDAEFSVEDKVSELTVKAGSTETVEIPVPETGTTVVWDLTVLGWEVNYKEEFIPTDEGSYTIIIQKGKKMGSQEEAFRNSFRSNEPGRVVLTIENGKFKKKVALFRYKVKSSAEGAGCLV